MHFLTLFYTVKVWVLMENTKFCVTPKRLNGSVYTALFYRQHKIAAKVCYEDYIDYCLFFFLIYSTDFTGGYNSVYLVL